MPGVPVVQGSQPVEFVEESNFGTAETDPSMEWVGLINSFDANVMAEEEIIKYLPADSDAIDLQTLHASKASEMHEIEMTYYPQDLDFLQYFQGGVGSLYPTLTPIEFGQQDKNNGEYSRFIGCVGEEYTLSIQEDSTAEITTSFIAADMTDWTSSDYIGAGSHASATDPSSTPAYTYDDLGTVAWGGSDIGHSIGGMEITVSNELVVVKDPNATVGTHIDAIVPVDREITVSLDLTYHDMSLANDVRSFTKQDLTFNFPSSDSWRISNVAFPEFPYEFSPDDLVADSVESVPATNLTIS